jgi:hypothetical protein
VSLSLARLGGFSTDRRPGRFAIPGAMSLRCWSSAFYSLPLPLFFFLSTSCKLQRAIRARRIYVVGTGNTRVGYQGAPAGALAFFIVYWCARSQSHSNLIANWLLHLFLAAFSPVASRQQLCTPFGTLVGGKRGLWIIFCGPTWIKIVCKLILWDKIGWEKTSKSNEINVCK